MKDEEFKAGQPVRVRAVGGLTGGAVGRVAPEKREPFLVEVQFPGRPGPWPFTFHELEEISEEEYLVTEVMAS